MNELYRITPREEKIRSRWLKSAVALYLIFPFFEYAFFLTGFSRTEVYPFGMAVWWPFIKLLLVYFLAYKRPGTRWLTFSMWMAAFSFVLEVTWYVLFEKYRNELIFCFTLKFPFVFFYIFNSCKLRVMNENLQIQAESTEYLEAVTRLKGSTTLEELDIAYHLIIQRWPRLERASTREYKEAKLKMSSNL